MDINADPVYDDEDSEDVAIPGVDPVTLPGVDPVKLPGVDGADTQPDNAPQIVEIEALDTPKPVTVETVEQETVEQTPIQTKPVETTQL